MNNNPREVLLNYYQLENDSRRYVEMEDEITHNLWLDEAIEADLNVVRCYINQYINLPDLPDYMQKILEGYEYTLKEKESMIEVLKKAQESLE